MIKTAHAKLSGFKLRILLLALALVLFWALRLSQTSGTETLLVPAGAIWKYLDNGTNQGTAWRAPAFDDGAWPAGPAELGYGDGDETTVVSYGPNPSNKYVTTYFRHSFIVADTSVYKALALRLLRDDGAVVYLNGTEVFSSNMPTGVITYTSLAASLIDAADETTFYSTNVDPRLLVAGTNVLAVEVHQRKVSDSDISFNLELIGSDTLAVIRGPYLQMGTPTSAVIRWRTNGPSDSRALYGTDQANLDAFADGAAVTTEHEITLSGLLPNTTYYYSVGTATETLAGGDASHFFITSPASGTSKPTRIWVLGDSGTADANAAAVRDAYLSFTGSRHTDLWLMLGDNAYDDGTDSQYQAAVFDMYPTILRQSVLWPTLGNHDGRTAVSLTQTGPYYDIFTLPKQAEAGGLASGTEAYYSFDYGNIHFICLDSFGSDRSTSGPMLTWLQSDLAATLQQWIIAFWHHPPYSKGSHDSDTQTPLIEMRENALPILEAGGVDLVLSGHSHSYERSFLLDGHYGTSDTLTENMIKDVGDGRQDGRGAYQKPTLGPASHDGAVYAVAGSSGHMDGGSLNHPAMFISLASLGSLVLDINGSRLNSRFIDNAGVTLDYFTILKGSSDTAPLAPSNLTATAASSSRIDLAWTDNSKNEYGFKIERSTDGNTFQQIVTIGANFTTYSNTSLTASTTYYYRAHTYDSVGDSAYSNIAIVTTPSATPPTITSFTPSSGPVGTTVAIAGNSFTGTTGVSFNTTAATFAVLSGTEITATVPTGASTGPISVNSPSGTGSSSSDFTVTVPPPVNLLANPGFELDANSDGKPDSWTSNNKFTRSPEVVHGGGYAGRHFATDGLGYTTLQTVNSLTAGTTYSFSGWVNIPPTNDSFTFKLQARWRNASNSTISVTTIKTYTTSTGGWDQATTVLVAPAATASAQVQMVVSSLNAAIYVDDLVFNDLGVTPPSLPAITSFMPSTGPVVTVVSIAGSNFTGATGVKFNAATATFTVVSATQITATVPTGASSGPISVTTPAGSGSSSSDFTVTVPVNLLVNPGFELDANNDGRLDNWTGSSKFTRSSSEIHSGGYAGKHFATDNSGYTISQTLSNLTAGTAYTFSGWVNIPPTGDVFTFKLQVIWKDAGNITLSTKIIKTYKAATSGWDQATASLVSPAGTTNVRVEMVASSLNATIYVDDFLFFRP